MAEYSIALEKQLEACRLMDSEDGRHAVANLLVKDSDEETLAGWVELLQDAVCAGESYYWSPRICELVETAAPSMPDWTLTRDMVPRAGFYWFARPLSLPVDEGGHTYGLHALSWAAVQGDPSDEVMLALAFWVEQPPHPLQPFGLITWHCGVSLSDLLTDVRVGVGGEEFARYTAAAFAFVSQRILVSHRLSPDRSARRRLAAWDREPLINVVQLRRRAAAHAEGHGETDVEWGCQWIVNGHWRQQWYPSIQRHQAVWILPYIKGPEDKPLRPHRTRVFAVVR